MKNKNKKIKKKAQVAIFVILALMIVVLIVMLFLLLRKPELEIEDPHAYIQSCVREYAEEAIDILSKQGGDIEPEGSTMYQGDSITYLCYTQSFYKQCVNQRPMLVEHVEEEITNYISPKIRNCFNSLKEELEKKDYIVQMGSMDLTTTLQPKQVAIDIQRDFKMTKRDETRQFDEFEINIVNPIYDLTKYAMEITNQEATYCDFNTLGFMLTYPDYEVEKTRRGNSDIIYTIRYIPSNKEFRFATRSCVLPPGL